MGRMNIYLEKEEDEKLIRLQKRFNIKSKEDVIKRLIRQFPETKSELSTPDLDIDIPDLDKIFK